jgi:hypothetical protein
VGQSEFIFSTKVMCTIARLQVSVHEPVLGRPYEDSGSGTASVHSRAKEQGVQCYSASHASGGNDLTGDVDPLLLT